MEELITVSGWIEEYNKNMLKTIWEDNRHARGKQ